MGFEWKGYVKDLISRNEPQLIKRHSFIASDLTSRLPYKNDELMMKGYVFSVTVKLPKMKVTFY